MSTNNRGPVARFLRLLLVLGGLYLLLVGANLAYRQIGKSIRHARTPEAHQEVEKMRRRTEDAKQIAAAVATGALPLLFPEMAEKRAKYRPYVDVAWETRLPPLGAYLNAPMYYCNEGYGLAVYTTDRFGLRNPDALWDAPTGIDTLVIGDAYVQGGCVASDAAIPAQLGEAGFVAANLGTNSNQPQQYALLARAFAPAVKPRFMAMAFSWNDLRRGVQRDQAEGGVFVDILKSGDDLSRYFAREGDGLAPSEAYRAAMARYEGLMRDRLAGRREKRSFLDKVFKREYWEIAHLRTLVEDALAGEEGLDALSRLAVDEMRDQCRAHGCKALVVYVPENRFVQPNPTAGPYGQALAAYADGQGLAFLDLSAALDPLGREAWAIKGRMLSPAGYAAAAAAIAAKLETLAD